MRALICSAVLATAIASPILTTSKPSVFTKNGMLIGQTAHSIDNFLGIPYAQPPVKGLRLRPPMPVTEPHGRLDLPTTPSFCPQQNLTAFNLTGFPAETVTALGPFGAPLVGNSSEDCLTLDIQRPAGTCEDDRLPVLFWIHGGGWQASAPADGSLIVNKSVEIGSPIIYVGIRYRLGAYGWLAGKEIQADDISNLGLKDQRLAMQWVSENICAFGGDPSKVTIWGESAGAYSAYSHLKINNGDNKYNGSPLFRGAIMNSGSIIRAEPVNGARPQAIFESIVAATGCSSAVDALDCLRAAPFEVFDNASKAQPDFLSYHALALSWVPRHDPLDSFYDKPESGKGAYTPQQTAKVPALFSHQEDEGTLFSIQPRNLITVEDLVDYLRALWPTTPTDILRDYVSAYPAEPAAGSPFNTGAANQLYPQFKRLAALQGDMFLALARRQALASYPGKAWTYLASYFSDTPILGTFHASDLSEEFGLAPDAIAGENLQTYIINFVNSLDPNGARRGDWPAWTEDGRAMLRIGANNTAVIRDDFRKDGYDFLVQHPNSFRI